MNKLITSIITVIFCFSVATTCLAFDKAPNINGLFSNPEYIDGKPVKYKMPVKIRKTTIDKMKYPPNCLIIWTASWCNKCPKMKQVGDKLSKDGFDVFYIDFDKNIEEASEKFVRALPTAIVYTEYEETLRIVGIRNKDTVEKQIRSVLKKNKKEEKPNEYRIY